MGAPSTDASGAVLFNLDNAGCVMHSTLPSGAVEDARIRIEPDGFESGRTLVRSVRVLAPPFAANVRERLRRQGVELHVHRDLRNVSIMQTTPPVRWTFFQFDGLRDRYFVFVSSHYDTDTIPPEVLKQAGPGARVYFVDGHAARRTAGDRHDAVRAPLLAAGLHAKKMQGAAASTWTGSGRSRSGSAPSSFPSSWSA